MYSQKRVDSVMVLQPIQVMSIAQEIAPELDPRLIAAIVQVESMGDPDATRDEPHYRWVHRESIDKEYIHQRRSWGLMQIMGAVARELGHDDRLTDLRDPYTNIRLGAKYLRALINRWPRRDEANIPIDAISAYNAGHPTWQEPGGNHEYVNKVLAALRDITKNHVDGVT